MAYGTVNADVIQSSVSGVSLGAGNASIMKNRIINGAMVIDQRNAGASVTPTSGVVYTLDRWASASSQASKFSVQQNAGSVTPPAGFTNYLGATSLSAYSVPAGDYCSLEQMIEGFNIADLGWGTANAKIVTLSFKVYSSLTGTFGGSLSNSALDRSYPFTYSIPIANTWTTISVTIAGDTSGTWLTTNGIGIRVYFGLGVGSTYSGTAGSWAGALYLSATGATSVVGTNGATFYITGVQLEVGSSATGFEYRQYQQELALCQRYYEKSYDTGTVPATATDNGRLISICGTVGSGSSVYAVSLNFATEKRIAPTMVSYDQTGASGKITTFNAVAAPTNNVSPNYGFGETSTRGTRMATVGAIAGIGCQWTASSEL